MTKEEVLKKFKELGYEYIPLEKLPHMVLLIKDIKEIKKKLSIWYNTDTLLYWKLWSDGRYAPFNIKEHGLLTELFIAWEE